VIATEAIVQCMQNEINCG